MEVTAQEVAGRKYPMQFLCDLVNAVLDGATGEMLEYRHLITCPKYKEVWGESYGKEVGRLAQGIPGKVEGTDTIFFIHKDQVPPNRQKICYQGQDCLHSPSRKRGPKQNESMCDGQPHQSSRRQRNTNC